MSARDNAERPLASLPVRLVVSGGHARVIDAVTDGNGSATFSYQGTLGGVKDSLEVQANYGGTALTSANSVVTWAAGANAAPVVSAGPDTVGGLSESVVLNGTASDDGQPVGSALTITWTKVSGPGDVVFLEAKRARTPASFSVAGAYVLKLSASDGVYTTEDTVAVTVTPMPTVSGGWLVSPYFGAEVSGETPVLVDPAVTLVSGVLTWWPAEDESAVRTLNASVFPCYGVAFVACAVGRGVGNWWKRSPLPLVGEGG